MLSHFQSLWITCVNVVDELFRNCLKTITHPHNQIAHNQPWVQTIDLYKVCSQIVLNIYTPFLYFFNLLGLINPHNPQGLLKQLLFYINNIFINDNHLISEV